MNPHQAELVGFVHSSAARLTALRAWVWASDRDDFQIACGFLKGAGGVAIRVSYDLAVSRIGSFRVIPAMAKALLFAQEL